MSMTTTVRPGRSSVSSAAESPASTSSGASGWGGRRVRRCGDSTGMWSGSGSQAAGECRGCRVGPFIGGDHSRRAPGGID